MASGIPFAKLGIPLQLEARLAPDAPRGPKLALARALVPMDAVAQLGVLYALTADPDPEVAEAARRSLVALPTKQVIGAISHRTHPKILEFLAEFREPDRALDERIATLRAANDRTVRLIARRADKDLCEQLSRNHERLLMVPELYLDLRGNPNCDPNDLARAESFLRMHKQLPEVPDEPAAAPPRPDAAAIDLEAEVMAAITGQQSPALLAQQAEKLEMFDVDADDGADPDLGMFSFDFKDDSDEFDWDLTADREAEGEEKHELKRSIEQKIAEMSVGQKIKLAYLGNKEVRAVLIRDNNKVVASAVVRSGRLTDQEVASYAGNKNLDNEVLREIASNGEWLRKYPVKVALVNNPKTPVSVAVSLVGTLQKKDLMALTRNRNVPSVVTQAANRLYKQKYKR